jgi:hypothetical protein
MPPVTSVSGENAHQAEPLSSRSANRAEAHAQLAVGVSRARAAVVGRRRRRATCHHEANLGAGVRVRGAVA